MPTTPNFDAISLADLTAVIGGCGKKKQQCCPCPPPQAAPQAAPPPSGGGGTEITTNVQMTGFGAAQ